MLCLIVVFLSSCASVEDKPEQPKGDVKAQLKALGCDPKNITIMENVTPTATVLLGPPEFIEYRVICDGNPYSCKARMEDDLLDRKMVCEREL
jgi:hypothetical protein